MGGLYITPNSTEMGWKRRGLRVSSEALLCLGVATIVASFVVDVNADGSKPNIWILIGGVIMIMAAAIGWSLTFCLIWETIQSDNNGSDQNPKAPIHSIQVVVPENDTKSKLDPTYMPAASSKARKKASGGGRKSKDTTIATGSGSKGKSSSSSGGRRKKQTTSASKTTTSKTSRSSDYSRSTATTNTNSSSYTTTTGSTNSSSYDSSSYSSSEQRKSYV